MIKANKIFKFTFLLYLFLFSLTFLSFGQQIQDEPRDGKLLRGELWQKYEVSEEADFYVAENGNDRWSGTLATPNAAATDGPFATIKRAQEAVRVLKSEVYKPKDEPVETRWIGSPHLFGKGKDILVLIRHGYYSLDEPLIFSAEDGGERIETNLPTGAFEYHKLKDQYVTYAAYPGEKPIISGGKIVKSWKKNRKHWVADVNGFDVTMIVANGKKQMLARTPNEGYFIPPKISESTDELYFNPGELMSWKNMDNNRVFMLLRWHHGINSFSEIDEKNGVAKLVEPQDGIVIVPPRYYVENVKELMDVPGEWYYDQKDHELSFIPPTGTEDVNAMVISAPQLQELLIVKGERGKPVRNLRFYGLTFDGVLAGKSAVSLSHAFGNEFINNELRAAAGTGILLTEGCYQTKIINNKIHGVDNMAIHLKGPTDPASGKDILRETLISYNHISNCGGTNIQAAYSIFTTISHNYITKTRGRYAISVGGWSNLEEMIDGAYTVEYNHLDDVQKDADDSGAIKTAGTTFNSVVQKNLVHGVNAGFFNDNVGFWFDNMSLGWVAKDNIFYNLEQGEMKLCAANLVDNLYENNYVIDAPAIAPETFISGVPKFKFSDLQIHAAEINNDEHVASGSNINISAKVFNEGSTGIAQVQLYLDGKVFEIRDVPVIHGNSVQISFNLRLYDEGSHQLAIGSTDYKEIIIKGSKPAVVFEKLKLSDYQVLKGEKVLVRVIATNLKNSKQDVQANLFIDNRLKKSIPSRQTGMKYELSPGESMPIEFLVSPEIGVHQIRIGNSNVAELTVQDFTLIDFAKSDLSEYCSAKAKPYEINADKVQNTYRIKAGGSDFYHAEDSYASVFLKKIKGDFVATVKIKQFGDRTHEWFRAGLFARNDISQSFDTKPGSKGSFLMFGTPGRAGVNYDEFANGCMHKANSQNLPENVAFPYWLKLERHGNYFVGYISLDGENWINEKRSANIPGLAEDIDLGLAAGSPDQIPYWVDFEDWTVKVAKQ